MSVSRESCVCGYDECLCYVCRCGAVAFGYCSHHAPATKSVSTLATSLAVAVLGRNLAVAGALARAHEVGQIEGRRSIGWRSASRTVFVAGPHQQVEAVVTVELDRVRDVMGWPLLNGGMTSSMCGVIKREIRNALVQVLQQMLGVSAEDEP